MDTSSNNNNESEEAKSKPPPNDAGGCTTPVKEGGGTGAAVSAAETDEVVAMDTAEPQPPPPSASSGSSKTLKRCLSVPIIRSLSKATPMTTRAAAAAAAAARTQEQTPKKQQQPLQHETSSHSVDCFGKNIHIRSQPSSREVSPAPMFNIFTPRTRRYSASYSPLTTAANGTTLCLTPRVSQLRQEECADLNSREVNHEREVHREIQISQSWEDLTLVTENWSCKSDELSNPLQVTLPPATASNSCSSPSPTNNRAGMRLPYSPSPTRRTFATRRSLSPIAMRPSQLGPVKRKFELDDNPGASNWSVYSPPPLKKIFSESRGSSPVCQSPSSVCPSPDSGTYDGRITPKLFISKLCTSNTNTNNGGGNNNSSSGCPSPVSASPSGICVPGLETGSAGNSEPMSMCSSSSQSIDEGISIPESEPLSCRSRTSSILSTASSMSGVLIGGGGPQVLVNDLVDDATLMDDAKSETSSIGGCSTISLESSSCDSGAKAAATFLNRLVVDDCGSPHGNSQKSFYINKQGISGAKKYIVNHENLNSASTTGTPMELGHSKRKQDGNSDVSALDQKL